MARSPKVSVRGAGPADAPSQAASVPTPAPTLSPSAELIAKAVQASVIPDAKGRLISLRKPSPLAQFQLVEALGEVASNEAYMAMAMPLIYVGAIDDEPVHVPKKKLQVEALIQKLGDEGLAVTMGWYVENIVAPTMDKVREAQERAALKN